MQFCVVFALVASLVSVDFVPRQEVFFAMHKLIGIVSVHVLVGLVAWAITCQTRAEVDCQWISRREAVRRLQARHNLFCALWIAMCLTSLTVFEWGAIVNSLPLVGSKLIRGTILLTPMVLSLIASWSVWFDAEQALDPSFMNGSRWTFVRTQVRHYLCVPLVPLILVIASLDVVDHIRLQSSRPATKLLSFLPLAALVMTYPWLLRFLWPTQSLASGPIRDRLSRLCELHHVSPQDILVWRTRGQSLNAAVAGIFPWLRYVLLTDKLIAKLPIQHVENVLLHEIAHLKLRHGLKLMILLGGMLGAGCAAVAAATQWLGAESSAPLFIGIVTLISLACAGWTARLYELQADDWAARQIGCPNQYIEAVARISSATDDGSSWLHPSFQRRHDFLAKQSRAAEWLRFRLRIATWVSTSWIAVFSLLAAILCAI